MRDGETQVYAALAASRTSYIQMQWSRIQIALAFNIIAGPVLYGAGELYEKFAISAAAVTVHMILLHTTLRAHYWIKYFERQLIALEQLAQEGELELRVTFFSHPDFQRRRRSAFATRNVLGVIGLAITLLWIAEAFIHGLEVFS